MLSRGVFVAVDLTVMIVMLVVVFVIVMPVLMRVLNPIEVLVHVEMGYVILALLFSIHASPFVDMIISSARHWTSSGLAWYAPFGEGGRAAARFRT
jgi:hypothetical protein